MTIATPSTAGLGTLLQAPALSLVLATAFWSGNFVAGRALRDDIDPLALNVLRWTLALAVLAPCVWPMVAARGAVLRREWRLVLALGATGIVAFQTLVYMALQRTTATSAVLILAIAPIATLLAAAAAGLERPTPRQWGGAFLSLGGAAILVTRGDAGFLAQGLNRGDLLMLLAILAWSAYAVLLRRRPLDMPPALALMVPALAIAVATGIAALPGPAFASLGVAASVGYVAVFSSALAFLLWSHGSAQVGPARAGQFINLIPVFGVVLSCALLGEVPAAAQLIGGAVVLAGIALAELRPRPPLPAPCVRTAP